MSAFSAVNKFNENEGEKNGVRLQKEYKEFYLPKNKPSVLEIPKMNYVAVRGKGNPNEEEGDYKSAIGILYGISFTIKMSRMGSRKIDGYFEYVVPPLEGLWRQEGVAGIDYSRKADFEWISMIRLPEFVTKEVFDWAVEEADEEKGTDFSKAEFFTYNEGLCVQCMHFGPYDDEPQTLRLMEEYAEREGYSLDMDRRRHHEIYLGDPRKCKAENLKTVIREPIKKR